MSVTPKEMGYRMPAEWTHHSGTLLSWPSNPETWPGQRLDRVEVVFLEILKAISSCETVHLILSNDLTAKRAKAKIRSISGLEGKIIYHEIPGNDLWARDFGPIFIQNQKGKFALNDWGYNAWGGKYPPFDADNAVPSYFSEKYGIHKFSPGIILEGGSIDTNGKGVLLTTESVLLNPNRNPHLSKSEIEEYLIEWLGMDKVIWLKDGLAGDDTDGHIDDISRFVNESTIITMVTEDRNDINYEALQENLEILKSSTDHLGNSFTIVEIPMPITKVEGEKTVDGSEFVPASYANFYYANNAVILPVYDKRYDNDVIRIFEKLHPNRKIIPIPCADLVWGQGSIHCITQQLYGITKIND